MNEETYFGQRPVFEALEQAAIRYCVLRFEPRGDIPEIDLLVDERDFRRLDAILDAHRIAPVLSWGNAPHSFFIGYDAAAGHWIKWDVVTDIRYGAPIRALSTDLAAEILRERRHEPPLYVLAPEHRLLRLLLHSLIHARQFDPGVSSRMKQIVHDLAADAASKERAIRAFERCLAPAVSWHAFERAVETESWHELIARRRAVLRRLFRRNPLRAPLRHISGRVLRLLRPLWTALRYPGVSIALLGPDGAGKSTLARQLAKEPFISARIVYLGTNPQASTVALPGAPRFQLWTRQRGGNAALALRIVSFAVRLVDQWFRYAVARFHLRRGRFVVFDRFPHEPGARSSRLSRLRDLIARIGCPQPDLIVLLDAPVETLHSRKPEEPLAKLRRQREAYLDLKTGLPQIIVMDATEEPERLRREAVALLWQHYRKRLRRISGAAG